MKSRDEWKAEVEAFKAAALREHKLMRHWQARALQAETQLKLYDQREQSR